MIHSLRFRLLVAMMAGVVVIVTLFGMAIYLSLRGALIAEIDTSLLVAAQSLSAAVKIDHGKVKTERGDRVPLHGADSEAAFVARVWLDGTPQYLGKTSALADQLPQLRSSTAKPTYEFLTTSTGVPIRAIGLTVSVNVGEEEHEDQEHRLEQEKRLAEAQFEKERASEKTKREGEKAREQEKKRLEIEKERRKTERKRSGDTVRPATAKVTKELMVVVARDSSELLARLAGLRWLLLGAGAGTVLIGVGVTLVTLHRGLVPLTRVAAEIAAMKADDLTAQLSRRGLPSEMAPVVERLNDLLGRVAAAFSRERAFAADAAHELRTPVAGLRTTLEVALATSPSAAEQREALADALQITLQMQSLVENLLTLTRLESGHVAVADEPIDLAALIDECWRRQRQLAVKRGLKFENRLPEGLTTRSDKTLLDIVFANLLQNAAQYTNEGGRIWVDASVEDGWLTATVANTGCKLARDQLGQVFDRFWRGDAARSQTGLHAGLGLALVQRIVTALGGRVEARLSDDGVFTICAAWKQPGGNFRPPAPSLETAAVGAAT